MEVTNQCAAPMPEYKSHKKVWALKIATVEVIDTDSTTDENPKVRITFEDKVFAPQEHWCVRKPIPQPGWYLVHYEDGYVSFSPGETFENGYTLLKPGENPHGVWHSIGWAVKMMQDGMRVRRSGWNGKGMWIGIVPGDQWGLGSGQNAYDYGAAGPGMLLPWVGMRTAQGTFVPWLCSQTDLLATDWEIAE